MSFPPFRESLLLTQFREFYKEILRLKSALNVSSSGSELPRAETSGPEMTPQFVFQQLLSALERQALQAERSGGSFAYEVYREAQYVFAALADEVFLQVSWPWNQEWPLLESKLFQSHVAGELFFDKVDRLLYRRDPVYQDLAAVYFMALALGFQGKYRGAENEAQLDRYRRELFSMVFLHPPQILDEDLRLFPQNYLHTLREAGAKKLPDPRNWLALIPIVILLWLLLSTVLWSHLTSEIESTLCTINPASCSGSAEVR